MTPCRSFQWETCQTVMFRSSKGSSALHIIPHDAARAVGYWSSTTDTSRLCLCSMLFCRERASRTGEWWTSALFTNPSCVLRVIRYQASPEDFSIPPEMCACVCLKCNHFTCLSFVNLNLWGRQTRWHVFFWIFFT